MPLSPACVGALGGHRAVPVDVRWTMAYAAGVPDDRPELVDTDGDLVVHPLFPVAPEWDLVTTTRVESSGLTGDEVRRGIHMAHDLVLHRPLTAEGTVHLDALVRAVGRRRAGATQEMLFTATDDDGVVMWRTRNTSLFLGVDLDGEPTEIDLDWPSTPSAPDVEEPLAVRSSFVRSVDAHVYSECARIWNPIHTDVRAARRAGLTAPILHGTATLARAVSIATELAGWDLVDVRRIAGRFANSVDLGTTIHVRVIGADGDHLFFDVVRDDGRPAIADGLVTRA